MEEIMVHVDIVFSVIAAVFALSTFVWTVRRDRKQATLDAYNRLQEQVFDKLNHYTPAEIRETVKHPRSEEYKTISGYVARIEHFCVGVNTGIYDFATLYALAHGYFDGYVLRPRMALVIDRKQANAPEDYYANIRKVLKRMDRKSAKKNPEKKAPARDAAHKMSA